MGRAWGGECKTMRKNSKFSTLKWQTYEKKSGKSLRLKYQIYEENGAQSERQSITGKDTKPKLQSNIQSVNVRLKA